MQYIIGFLLIIIGGVSTAVTGFTPLVAVMLVGVFMFASIKTEGMLTGYTIANTEVALLRKRKYYIFLPFAIVSWVLTLRQATLLIPYKESYFTGKLKGEELELTPLTRKEYRSMLAYQRKVYSQGQLSREFMTKTYTPETIGLGKKKWRLMAAVIAMAVIGLSGLTVPGGYWLTLIYAAVLMPMILLWIPEYKDAQILQQAYDRAMMQVR